MATKGIPQHRWISKSSKTQSCRRCKATKKLTKTGSRGGSTWVYAPGAKSGDSASCLPVVVK